MLLVKIIVQFLKNLFELILLLEQIFLDKYRVIICNFGALANKI